MSKIQKLLQDRFHPDVISTIEACKILKLAFPSSQNKRLSRGGVKQTYVLGLEIMEATQSQGDDREQLLQRIRELEGKLSRYQHFEHFLEEVENMVSLSVHCLHGPDTLPRLNHFSFDGVIEEFQMYAPELYHLFRQLGDSERNRSPQQSHLTVEEMKTVTSLCTLFNARSQRFKGLQLLMSLMLVARGTSKQVIANTNTCSRRTKFNYLDLARS